MENFDNCSSDLERDNSFYHSDESCDYDSDCSHDYHCSKCSKPREVAETRNAASHRALDKMKFVSAERERLTGLSDQNLTEEFAKRFRVRGKKIDREEKILRLMKTFIPSHRPDKIYRLANKFFDSLVLEWTETVCDPMEPEIEDVVDEIVFNLNNVRADFQKLREKLIEALRSEKETGREKIQQVSRLFDVPISLCVQSTCDQMKIIRSICCAELDLDFERLREVKRLFPNDSGISHSLFSH